VLCKEWHTQTEKLPPLELLQGKICDLFIVFSNFSVRFGTVMTLSSLSTTSLEDVIKAGSTMSPAKGIYWFQLYAYKNEDITRDLIRRAETSGYQAIVLTVDTPMLGRREPDLRNHFSLPSHLTIANFQKYFENSQKNSEASTMTMNTRPTIATKDSANNNSAVANYFSLLINDSLTWEHTILWIKSNTKLKIVLKGIITPEEALTATQYPVDAIWISNHGARQLDTAPATIETVAAIKAVVQNKCEIYVDGGITRGTDIFMVRNFLYFVWLCCNKDFILYRRWH
jgi:(S)-2-hydroxy-acid oxidase